MKQSNPGDGLKKSYDEIQAWLVNQLANNLSVDSSEINVNEPFNSFGLSSQDAVLLSGDLEDFLDRRISPIIVYEYPTIQALADYLATETEPQSSKPLETTLAQIEELSDEEAESLLLQHIEELEKKNK